MTRQPTQQSDRFGKLLLRVARFSSTASPHNHRVTAQFRLLRSPCHENHFALDWRRQKRDSEARASRAERQASELAARAARREDLARGCDHAEQQSTEAHQGGSLIGWSKKQAARCFRLGGVNSVSRIPTSRIFR